MTIIAIIINGKFLMIATPKKQIKNSKPISAPIRINQSFAFILLAYSSHLPPTMSYK
jgi:hypothetical protein